MAHRLLALGPPKRVHQSQPESYLERWESLPAEMRVPQQLAGIGAAACGATHSIMEKCNFACTSCYLSDVANYTTPLGYDATAIQLDELRAYLGPGGKCQITSGEVTLLDPHDLGRIVAYARRIGLDPMVMTNGQRLLQVDGYLEILVRQYGLEKIGIHIDTTQKGRPGLTKTTSEADLNTLRDRFAALLRQVRRETGKRLYAGSTVTVNDRNIAHIPEVVSWVLDNADSIRILSFLPVAEVGRTQDEAEGDLSLDAVWEKVCEGAATRLNRHAMYYGHTSCNITVPVVVVRYGDGRELIEVVRAHKPWDQRALGLCLRNFSHCVDLNRGVLGNALPLMRSLMVKPGVTAELILHALYRLWGARREVTTFLWHLITWRPASLRPLLLVVHKFMDEAELETELGRERLNACVFRLPVEGRMVSMCEMNARMRRDINVAQGTADGYSRRA